MNKTMATIGSSALTAMVLTLALFWPRESGANGPGESEAPKVPEPALTSKGCEITIQNAKSAYKPGEAPVAELLIRNKSAKTADVRVTVNLMLTPAGDPMSRMMRIPSSCWHEDFTASVEPEKSKTIPLSTGVKLGAGVSGYYVLSDGTASIRTAAFAVPFDIKALREAYSQK